MANFIYEKALTKIALGDIHFDTDDIRVLLVGTITTADTETEVEFISGFTTLDEFTDASYARKTLTTKAVNEDLANNRAEFDADNVTWTALTGDTAQAAIVYKFVTNDADSIPIAYIDTGGFPQTPAGADLTINWNAEGIIQFS